MIMRSKKHLTDEDTLNIQEIAETMREEPDLKPKSHINSTKAHSQWLRRQQEQELFRQSLKKIWNKKISHRPLTNPGDVR